MAGVESLQALGDIHWAGSGRQPDTGAKLQLARNGWCGVRARAAAAGALRRLWRRRRRRRFEARQGASPCCRAQNAIMPSVYLIDANEPVSSAPTQPRRNSPKMPQPPGPPPSRRGAARRAAVPRLLALLAALLAAAALLLRGADAHGFLYEPGARNVVKSNFYDDQSGNGPGVCGDSFQGLTTNFVNEPSPSQATYAAGATITLRAKLTANHGGKFSFRLCPRTTGLDEACFGSNYLVRADNGQRDTWVTGAMDYTTQYRLPAGISGPAVLQWTYYAMQSCVEPGCDRTHCGVYADGEGGGRRAATRSRAATLASALPAGSSLSSSDLCKRNNVVCPAANQCQNAVTCNPATGTCPALTNKADGTSCTAVAGGTCQSGQCKAPVVGSDCTTDCGGCTDMACFCRLKGSGNFANPFDSSCASFLQCSNGIAYKQPCPGGLMYNSATGGCDWPANVKCNTCCKSAIIVPPKSPCDGVSCAAANECRNPGTCNVVSGAAQCVPSWKADNTRCSGGACRGGECLDLCRAFGISCPIPGECQNPSTCDRATGTCGALPPKPDNTPCNRGVCRGGTCTNLCKPQWNVDVTCPSPGVCQVIGTCDPMTGTCSPFTNKPDGTACPGGTCRGGQCSGPCAQYKGSDTNLARECLRHIWTSSGCTTAAAAIPDSYNGWWAQQTLDTVKADMAYYGAQRTATWRLEYCYGADRSRWPAGACLVANCASCVEGSGTTCESCATGFDRINGQCSQDRCKNVVCPAPNQCQNPVTCNAATGTCPAFTNKADGTACPGGTCRSGQCTNLCVTNKVVCPTPNQCQNPVTCNPVTGICPALTSKADGTACTGGTCRSGQCKVAVNPCLTANGGCSLNATCTNNNGVAVCKCKTGFTGTGKTCVKTCTSTTQCPNVGECQTKGTCDTKKKTCRSPLNKAENTRCSAGVCKYGVCTNLCSLNKIVCPAPNQCQNPVTCNAATGTCPAFTNKANGTACTGGTCRSGQCTNLCVANKVVCPTPNQCQNPVTCNAATGICPVLTSKADGTACTGGTCRSGQCTNLCVANKVICPTPNQCQNPATCNAATGICPALTNKIDGTACTGGTCRSGQCTNPCVANKVVCPTPNQCQDPVTCNPVTGICPALTNKADGTACTGGTCRGGQCANLCEVNNVVCPAPNQCQNPVTCNAATGICPALPNKADGTACTGGTCRGGQCANLCAVNNVVCPAPNQCQNAVTCNAATGICPALPNKADGTACTGGTCRGGQCTDLCKANNVACPAANECQVQGTCSPSTGQCSPLTKKADGTSCAAGSGTCTDGACTTRATTPGGPTCQGCSDAACYCTKVASGDYPNPFDATCGTYLRCWPGVTSPVASCSAGLMYNPATKGCSWPADVTCKPECPTTTQPSNCIEFCSQTLNDLHPTRLMCFIDTLAACMINNCEKCAAGSETVCAVCKAGFNVVNGQCSPAVTDLCKGVVCPAGMNECEVVAGCDSATGQCKPFTKAPDGTSCNAGSGTCKSGACEPKPPVGGTCQGCSDAACYCTKVASGDYPNPFDATCGTYLRCWPGVTSPVASCSAGLMYNPATKGCSWPADVTCKPECPMTTQPSICTATNCETCAAGSSTVCAVCKAGFNLVNGQCSAPAEDRCKNVVCPAPNQCQDAVTCNAATGTCPALPNKADGTACTGGTCQSGHCASGPTLPGDSAAGLSKSQFTAVFLGDSDKCGDCADFGRFPNTQAVVDRHWGLFKSAAAAQNFRFSNVNEAAVFFGHVKHEYGGALDRMVEQCGRKGQGSSCITGAPYYGRGPMQLSHDYNYRAMAGRIGADVMGSPDLLLDVNRDLGWRSAMVFWTGSDFNCMGGWVKGDICPTAAAGDNVAQVTFRINPLECVSYNKAVLTGEGPIWWERQSTRIDAINAVRTGVFGLPAIPKERAWCASQSAQTPGGGGATPPPPPPPPPPATETGGLLHSSNSVGTYYYGLTATCPQHPDGFAENDGYPKCASNAPGPSQQTLRQIGSDNLVAVDVGLLASEAGRAKYCGKKVVITRADGSRVTPPQGGDFFVWDACAACAGGAKIDFSVAGARAANPDACTLGNIPGLKVEIMDTQVKPFVA
ncbi:MAG: hypothetical protein J3K34DRAFT_492907 [Monoraphidium minutum]|nr:MAG: hypothetical protein J3K34DRAFT_492907 [Monoraphidium minutum]